MKTYVLSIAAMLMACTAVLCSCERNNLEVAPAAPWGIAYTYTTDRDGGMEGYIYVYDGNPVEMYIDGIGETIKLNVSDDGSFTTPQQGFYRADFHGSFTTDGLTFSYSIMTEPKVIVNYTAKKTDAIVPSSVPVNYRDKWAGTYVYADNTAGEGYDGTLTVHKVSYNNVGLMIGAEHTLWSAVLSVAEDGSLTLVDGTSDWGNFSGHFTDDSLIFSYSTLQYGERSYSCRKAE